MITLEISTGAVVAIFVGLGAAAYAFYRIGKKSIDEKNVSEKYVKRNPNTIQAQKAFLDNLPVLMPFFKGVSEIQIDKQGLTDAIIGINNDDLIALWNVTLNRPELFINQMAAWGIKADTCLNFVALDKHKAMYSTEDGTELILGERYNVASACWILTTDEGKRVVKKGIVNKMP